MALGGGIFYRLPCITKKVVGHFLRSFTSRLHDDGGRLERKPSNIGQGEWFEDAQGNHKHVKVVYFTTFGHRCDCPCFAIQVIT